MTLSQRLVTAGCALVLAVTAAPSYFLSKSLSKDIDFVTWEQYGNRYQRPLEQLLEALLQHRILAHRYLARCGADPLVRAGRPRPAEAGQGAAPRGCPGPGGPPYTAIDDALVALKAVDAELGH